MINKDWKELDLGKLPKAELGTIMIVKRFNTKIDIKSDVYKLVSIDISIDDEHNIPNYQDIWINLNDEGGFEYSLYKDDMIKEFEYSKYKLISINGVNWLNHYCELTSITSPIKGEDYILILNNSENKDGISLKDDIYETINIMDIFLLKINKFNIQLSLKDVDRCKDIIFYNEYKYLRAYNVDGKHYFMNLNENYKYIITPIIP